MTNPLKGLQYRTYKPNQFVTYLDGEDNYEEWKDVENLNEAFPSGTQLRIKPEYVYRVEDDTFVRDFTDKDKAMSYLAGLVEGGKAPAIRRDEKSTNLEDFLMSRHVQFSIGNGKWQPLTYMNAHRFSNRTFLRIRPDEYFVVSASSGISKAELRFEDVESLAKYLNDKVRTGMYNFSVRSVKYV